MSLLDKIGRIRLVELGTYNGLTVYAKCEHENPSGSIKDRIAYRMVTDAVNDGRLKKGMTITDISSGNTGIALAMVGRELCYPVMIVTGTGVTEEAKEMILGYGADLVPVNGHNDVARMRIKQMMDDSPGQYFYTKQDENPSCLQSNMDFGAEIYAEMASRGLEVDAFIASLGTGATVCGVGIALKQRNPRTKVCLVKPKEEYDVHGVGDRDTYSIDIPIFDNNRGVIDLWPVVKEEDAIRSALELHEKALYVGVSSGAIFSAAKELEKMMRGNVVIPFPDHMNRYTSLW